MSLFKKSKLTCKSYDEIYGCCSLVEQLKQKEKEMDSIENDIKQARDNIEIKQKMLAPFSHKESLLAQHTWFLIRTHFDDDEKNGDDIELVIETLSKFLDYLKTIKDSCSKKEQIETEIQKLKKDIGIN